MLDERAEVGEVAVDAGRRDADLARNLAQGQRLGSIHRGEQPGGGGDELLAQHRALAPGIPAPRFRLSARLHFDKHRQQVFTHFNQHLFS
ncbi:hypothetical protein GCM10022287_02690 [Gryllotalpicola koreensis]|uniref:Uncharacterized protein n=1 Tax=Gryllotalpicola koreensis TaxID=993086 RepID=A0ABP7ZQM1_9MICO